jgi:hypothetical protein
VAARRHPHPTVILDRDGVRIGFSINGGDASQDRAAIWFQTFSGRRRKSRQAAFARETGGSMNEADKGSRRVESAPDRASTQIAIVICGDVLAEETRCLADLLLPRLEAPVADIESGTARIGTRRQELCRR